MKIKKNNAQKIDGIHVDFDPLENCFRSNGELQEWACHRDGSTSKEEEYLKHSIITADSVGSTSWTPPDRERGIIADKPKGRCSNDVKLYRRNIGGSPYNGVWKQCNSEEQFWNEIKGHNAMVLLRALDTAYIQTPELNMVVGLAENYEPDSFTISKDYIDGLKLEELIKQDPKKAEEFVYSLGSQVRNVHDFFSKIQNKTQAENRTKNLMIPLLKSYFEKNDVSKEEYNPLLEKISEQISVLPEHAESFIFGDLSLTNVMYNTSFSDTYCPFEEHQIQRPHIQPHPDYVDENGFYIGFGINRESIHHLSEPMIIDLDSWRKGDPLADVGIFFGYLEEFQYKTGIDVSPFKQAFEQGYFGSEEEKKSNEKIISLYSAYKHIQNANGGNNVEFSHQRIMDIFGIYPTIEYCSKQKTEILA